MLRNAEDSVNGVHEQLWNCSVKGNDSQLMTIGVGSKPLKPTKVPGGARFTVLRHSVKVLWSVSEVSSQLQ